MQKPSKSNSCEGCDSRKDNIFCQLPKEALALLDGAKVHQKFKRGQYIFYSGNNALGVYCISDGLVKLETQNDQGQGHILHVLQKGDLLGYRSLFAEQPYEASALVHEDTEVCLIPKTAILEILSKHPDVAIRLLGELSREIKQTEARLCHATDHSAQERVAEAVLFLDEHFKGKLWTRKEIGEWAGTTPETVMRTLSSFEDEGLINTQGRKIEIKNRPALFKRARIEC